MKHYLLSTQQPDGPPPSSADLEQVQRNVDALTRELKTAGAWVFNGHLDPASSATVVRPQDGDLLMTDGPYTEGNEYVGESASSWRPISTPRSNGAARSPGRPPSRSRCGRSEATPRTDARHFDILVASAHDCFDQPRKQQTASPACKNSHAGSFSAQARLRQRRP